MKKSAPPQQPKDLKPEKVFGVILAFLRSCKIRGDSIDFERGVEHEQLYKLEREHFREWVSPHSILVEVLRRAYRKLSLEDAKVDRPLQDAIASKDLEEIAHEVTALLRSIPYPTTFYGQLRGVKLKFVEPLRIGGIALRNAGKAAMPQNSLNAIARAFTESTFAPPLLEDDVVLEITVSGYSRRHATDLSPDKALATLKEFLILAGAQGILTTGNPTPSAVTGALAELSADGSAYWVQDIPTHTAKLVDDHCLADAILEHRGLLRTGPRSNDEQIAEIGKWAGALVPVFSEPGTKHTAALRAAAQWLFDSLAENNQTRAFVFVSLGLEALLGGDKGDSDKVGVGRLLGNRLAYLVGGTRDQRELLVKEFDAFYGKRSAIIHGSAVRLDSEGGDYLRMARGWLEGAIERELSFMRGTVSG